MKRYVVYTKNGKFIFETVREYQQVLREMKKKYGNEFVTLIIL